MSVRSKKESIDFKLQEEIRSIKTNQVMLDCILRQSKRFSYIDDPVLRYRLPIEYSRMGMDCALSLCTIFLKDKYQDLMNETGEETEKTEQLRSQLDSSILEMTDKIEMIRETLEEFYDLFSEWISSPHYDPDHPVGHNLLETSAKDFKVHGSSLHPSS